MRVSITIMMFLMALVALGCEAEKNGFPTGPGDVDSDSDTESATDADSDADSDSDSDTDVIDTENMPPSCADGVLDSDEACDDNNHNNADGCMGDCLEVEEGWSCNPPGLPCHRMAVCGDGDVLLPEMCDDGANLDADGCSATCKIEIGWKCDGSPSVCSATTCGDGVKEGAEYCDDANTQPADGCTIDCQAEPACSPGAGCTSECGDGLKFGTEECDDGNSITGDGCSDTCVKEDGFTCTEVDVVLETISIPIILRDFSSDHEDFEFAAAEPGDIAYGMVAETPGLVQSQLSPDGKPVFARAASTNDTTLKANGLIHSPTSFAGWYVNASNAAATVVSELVLYDDDGDGTYVNRFGPNGEKWERLGVEYEGNPVFFPLDGFGVTSAAAYSVAKIPPNYFGLPDGSPVPPASDTTSCQLGEGCNPCWPIECVTGDVWANPGGDCAPEGQPNTWYTCYPSSPTHNFHFTSEVVYWFQYDAATTPTLSFTGDDDLWVFVNGKLALDLGGIHTALQKTLTVNAAMATQLGLTDGGVYDIRVFHAERQRDASTYRLTFSGFSAARSTCVPLCGDGVVTAGEQCDDAINDGGYGECGAGCMLDAYCGDGEIQAEFEDCDDGNFRNGDECPSSCREIVIE